MVIFMMFNFITIAQVTYNQVATVIQINYLAS